MTRKKESCIKRKTKQWKRKLLNLELIPFLGFLFVWTLGLTIHKKWIGLEKLEKFRQKGQFVIFVFWHGRLLMMPFINQGRRTGILSGHHVDAEISVRIYRYFGYYSVRGSSSRGGMAALRKLSKEINKGSDAGIAPDGPRGPRCRAQGGAVLLSRLTGCPLIPVTFGASKGKFLSSWDRFLIPYPFSQVVYIIGDPIWVGKKERGEELKGKQQFLEDRLNKISKRADEYFVTKGTE